MNKKIGSIKMWLLAGVIINSVMMFSCQPKKGSNQEQYQGKMIVEDSKYIAQITSGTISSKDKIVVQLKVSPTKVNNTNNELSSDIFHFDPSISGKTYLLNNTKLIFEPDDALPNGKNYSASIHLSELFEIPRGEKKVFDFNFNVREILLKVDVETPMPYDYQNSEWNYLEGSLSSSDELNTDDLSKLIRSEQDGNELKISWIQNTVPNKYSFRIDSIRRTENESVVLIDWDGEEVNSESSGEIEVPVLSLNSFAFVSTTVNNLPDQSVEIVFSDIISSEQLLDGLVYFNDQSDAQLTVEGNKIIVYPKTALIGNKTIVIKKEIKSLANKNLTEDVFQSVFFGQIKPQVKFKDDGVIMPGKDGWILPFEAVNLNAVNVSVSKIYANNITQFLQENRIWGEYNLYYVADEIYQGTIPLDFISSESYQVWNTFALDLSKMINAEPGAIYRVSLSFEKDYSLYECVEGEANNNDYWGRRDDPCSDSYYYNYYSEGHFAAKNILASNIGLTVKNSQKELIIYANNLLTNKEMSGVNLSFYTFQKQLIKSEKTNDRGVAKVTLEKAPFLVVAEKDGEFAYLKLQGGDALSYSKFETQGTRLTEGLKGFVYGDRGVWRPGDTLFLTLIVQNTQGDFSPEHPASLEINNPLGKSVFKQTLLNNKNGFFVFVVPTDQDGLTGIYNATVSVGGSSFNKQLRIENIKPNRLKIKLDFEKELLYGENNKAKLQVNWLHGGIASNLKAEIQANIRPTKTSFENFNNYLFDDPSRYFSSEELIVFSGDLDAKGMANIDLQLPSANSAPGMLKVNFVSKVFEKGGDFSTDQVERKYSPFSTYVGIKLPDNDGNGESYDVDKPLNFEIVTVNENGKLVNASNLEVAVYKLDWSWWYSSYGNSLSSYISNHYDEKIFETTVNTVNGKADFSFEIKYPDWGWFFVKVSDPEGEHSTGAKIYLDWPSWYNRDQRKDPGDATLLSLATDKEKYIVGEEVNITLPTPANAKILVSIEKNNKQMKSWWMESDSEETVIKFEATDEMSPNVYAYVSVLQPYSQTLNDLPIRMYGVVPVMVENPETVLQPLISIPKTVRPNEEYNITVSEKNDKKMTYTIAVVDEGLLDITKFSTPDPYNYFYAKEALGVLTWDMYDNVMGAYAGKIQQTFAVGGDDESKLKSGNKKAIRFKPVVSFIGPFELEAGKSATHQLKMPNYIGSVRCMVVAAEGQASGSAEQTMKVSQPLMVLATVPRVLAPGEKVVLPVSVFVMDEKIKNVNISVSANDLFKIKETKKQLTVDKIGEHTAYFEFDVNEKQGIGTVRVEVKSGNETAYYSVELNVRNPNPRMYQVDYHLLEKDEDWSFSPDFKGMSGTNELNLVVSGFPSINLEARMKYLVHYPYGCTEQITSSVFPQLYLGDLMKLSKKEKERIELNINLAIKKLYKRQYTSGGFAYWDGNSGVYDWATTYAGHFLLLAREKGYLVSSSCIDSWVDYQTKAAKSWSFDEQRYPTDFQQAYRLYSLALAGKAAVGAMNRLSEMKGLSASAAYRLAAAYALIGQEAKAKKLLSNVTYTDNTNNNYWLYTYGSETRDVAMQMETYLILNEKDKALPLFKNITDKLRSNQWMSTQTTAFCLYSVAEMIGNLNDNSALVFAYQWNNSKSGDIVSDAPVYSTPIEVGSGKELSVSNKTGKAIYAAVTTSGIPMLGEALNEQHNLKMKVFYKDMNGNAVDLNNIPHGLDFYAELIVQNVASAGYVDNIALSQLFPSGWEIINTRMLDLGSSLKSDKADYVDFKDDGVDMFFDLGRNQSKRFVILLNAAYMGEYYLPATQCKAMYDNEISATLGGGWVNIVGTK